MTAAGTWEWVSPNEVTHLVMGGGRCATCGLHHDPVTASAVPGGTSVSVSRSPHWDLRPRQELPPGLPPFDPAPFDAMLAGAGWERNGEWMPGSGCYTTVIRPAAGTVVPSDDEFRVRLPLTGAPGPLVTAWYADSSGKRYAAEVTFPDGSRCTVRLGRRQVSWADPQVWEHGNQERYQLVSYYCPGHGGHPCQYGMCDEVRYTGPLTDPDSPPPAIAGRTK